MQLPKPLRPGDTVALVALSSALRGDDVPGDVCRAADKLEALGFRVRVSPTCTSRWGFFAGSDPERAAALNEAFADDTVDGIWCIRGGYGTIRLLGRLDRAVIAANPKPFIGYSDVTMIHSVLGNLGLGSFHGPMPKSDDFTPPVTQSLMSALAGCPAPKLENLDGTALQPLRGGVAEGQLIGGNLSLIAAALGTPDAPDVRGKLLFIEEVGEYSYAVDRYLWHLKNAGLFRQCAGVIFGGFTRCDQEYDEAGFSTAECIRQLAASIDVPVLAGLQAGHLKESLTLPFGRAYRLDAGAASLTLCE